MEGSNINDSISQKEKHAKAGRERIFAIAGTCFPSNWVAKTPHRFGREEAAEAFGALLRLHRPADPSAGGLLRCVFA